jgi:hypothetical protein
MMLNFTFQLMYTFRTTILKYASKGEKTGWTYVEIPADILGKLKRKDRKAFRIKGCIDDVKFEKLSTYPVGNGEFIIAINGEMRKKLGKKEGALVSVRFEPDNGKPPESKELLASLKEDKTAYSLFRSLLKSHQTYFHRYVDSARGADTRAGRIVNVINAMYRKQDYGEMIRSLKQPD